MDIFACLIKLIPDWKGSVWNNSYDGIRPHEHETRPTPPLSELEAVWPDVQAEKAKEQDAAAAKAKLTDIDLQSIRSMREWIAKQVDAPQFVKDYEAQAVIERAKLK